MTWIRCSERIPETEGPHLIAVRLGNSFKTSAGFYVTDLGWVDDVSAPYRDVVAWMTLPEYKPDGD